MPFPWRGAVLLLLFQRPGPTADLPRALLRQTLLAVEGDSVSAVRARWSRALGRDPSDRAALLGLGFLARLTYDYGQADARLERVVSLRADDAYADYARMEQGMALLARGRLREAAVRFDLALVGAERRGDTTVVADALLGLAMPRSRLAPAADVLALLERAGRLTRGDPELEANVRCQRALVLSRTGGRGAGALAAAGAALARRAGALRQEGRCHQAVAQDLAAQGDLAGAAAALGRASPLFQRSGDHAALAAALQWSGYLYNSLGRYGEARAELTAAIAEGERSGATSPVGWALINLGMISLGLGDRITATWQLERAVGLLDEQGDEWGVATARSMLGGVARAAGDVGKAREAYARVLDWADRTGHVLTRFNMHEALSTLGEMDRDWPVVARHLAAAHAIARANRMAGWEAGLRYNDGRAALGRGDLAGAERYLWAFLAGADTSQHGARYAARALLAETYVRRGATGRGESELLAATEELDAWRASLSERNMRVRAMEADLGLDPDLGVATVVAALARAGRAEAAFHLVEHVRAWELNDEIARAEAALERAGPAEEHGLDRAPATNLAAVRDALADGRSALLEYVTGRGGEPTTLFVVTGGGLATHELAPIDSLAADLRRFATVLEGGGDARALGARLGAALLQPALEGLDPAVTRLIIVPDDVLARLAFDALVLDDGRYAVERFAIGVAPSAGTVIAVRGRPRRERPVRLLALGDPSFDPPAPALGEATVDPSTAAYRSAFAAAGGLTRLAGSAREVHRLARYAPSAEVRLGTAASEAYLRNTPLGSFRVLHFATHALVDEEAVTRTALALAPGGGHDGFLGPGDLATLALEADLVVLSSCRTAGGVVLRGEGIQGLTAPLLQAGARSVVATEWRIADTSAIRIMEGLYRALAGGSTVVDALHAAKLGALRAGAPPSEWAAFVAMGDPMVRVPLVLPASRRNDAVWAGAVATALLLVLAYLWRRRKRRGAEVA